MPTTHGSRSTGSRSTGPVLTRRGRLLVTSTVTAAAVVLAVQTLSAGSPPDPRASVAIPTRQAPDLAAEGSPTEGTTTMTPAPPPSGSPSATPAGTPVPPVEVPAVVNGRAQPQRVDVPTAASGELARLAGSTPPVSGARVWTYRVEVEQGLPFDPAEFAAAAHATLSDPRGWATDGNVFQRVDSDAVDFRLILASPDLTDRLCAPLNTRGQVSCRNGDMVVLNALRWGVGIDDYAGDVASYREYLVNHEVGHRLGRGHVECPGSGQPAPVMMQQTYGLDGCAPNSWPLPGE